MLKSSILFNVDIFSQFDDGMLPTIVPIPYCHFDYHEPFIMFSNFV